MKIIKQRKAVSTIEVMTVIILIMAVLIGFGGYIKGALAGRWKSAGDTFGQGRQFDPRGFGVNGEMGGTMDCFYDQVARVWIDEDKYRQNNCDCTWLKADGGHIEPEYTEHCTDCKAKSECAHHP